MGWWLIGYSLPFAAILLVLAGLLQRWHVQSSAPGRRPRVRANQKAA